MFPARYMLIDERSPYPVKRRVRGRRDERDCEPAITLLPPDPYMIMERPDFVRSSSPTVYRTVPPKSAKNKQASSFVILGETMRTPVQSRPASPSGRVSPFRGHGFKSPTTTRPNSRAASPAHSPKKVLPKPKPVKVSDRPRINKDIGLPPKSPMKVKTKQTKQINLEKPEVSEENAEEESKLPEDDMAAVTDEGTPAEEESPRETDTIETKEEQPKSSEPEQKAKSSDPAKHEKPSVPEKQRQKPPPAPKPKQRLTPATPRDKKLPKTPSPRPKTKIEKNEANQQSVIKKAVKPPIAPKKIGIKSTLKTEDNVNKKSTKELKPGVKENNLQKSEETVEIPKPPDSPKKISSVLESKENVTFENEVEKKKKVEEAVSTEQKEGDKEEKAQEKNSEKLVPCFQPDKCQIAPPTMASPSPIITPTISTPSTTADLASGSVKNSQSIATAPTTVTPSSLSSVSSTVVLTGNLARKEIEKIKSRAAEAQKADTGEVLAKEADGDSGPREKAPVQMVKAATKDSLKWSKKDSLSGEITSTTKVIKADPDMEVLSPNNLRDSPPRMPPPNLAWDEGRLPNGDVPNKTETEGKCRRFISAVWKFLSYLFCCRWVTASKCCRRKPSQDAGVKPSFFSKLNCCKGKSCGNPFKCCTGCCKSKCCEGKKCCRRNPKPENPKPKPRKCCAKVNCCKGCCDKIKARCLDARRKLNNVCRSLFCLNTICCQNFLRKFTCCHKFKICQKNGFCSCCNPNVKRDMKKLNKKGSRASNNSKPKRKLDPALVETTSLMKAAIPVLPPVLATFCLVMNIILPGTDQTRENINAVREMRGTFFSGIFCLFCGKARFSVNDTPKSRLGSFLLNSLMAVSQLFTITFCLVGWGWSIWWGIIMYKLAKKQKRLSLAAKSQKEAEAATASFSQAQPKDHGSITLSQVQSKDHGSISLTQAQSKDHGSISRSDSQRKDHSSISRSQKKRKDYSSIDVEEG